MHRLTRALNSPFLCPDRDHFCGARVHIYHDVGVILPLLLRFWASEIGSFGSLSTQHLIQSNCSRWTFILYVSVVLVVKTAHQVVNLVDGKVSRNQNLGSTYYSTMT